MSLARVLDMSFMSAFEAQARRTPDAVAVRSGDERLTYAELDRQTANLARHLVDRGIGPERAVGVALPRSPALLVGIVGVLKSGAAYMPLDVTYPQARLTYSLEDARAGWVLTTQACRDAVPGDVAPVLIDSPECMAALALDDAVDRAPRQMPAWPDQAAYIIHTSGSTGVPKGIVVSHRALSTFIGAAAEYGCITADDRIVAVTTVAFDISLLELLVPLCLGAEVVIAGADIVKDPLALIREFERAHPTVVQATPSQWRTIVQHPCDVLRHLRVLVGGEPLPRDLAALLHRSTAGVINLYGPTEATIWATAASVGEGALQPNAPPVVDIGRALPGYGVYVLDEALRHAAPGDVGEIYISGPAVARGYCRQPRLTAGAFVPDPHAAAGARMYRTGDVGTRRADGSIAFQGRHDRQVKIRGHRIELGEIEAALTSHDEVSEAVVTAQRDEQRLLAYVVCKRNESARAAAHVSRWQSIWEAAHQRHHDGAGDMAIAVSQAPQVTAADESRASIEAAATRLGALWPRRVVEIGCGRGELLTRLAPDCDSYVAIDFSPQAIASLERHLAQQPQLAHVELRRAAAHDLSSLAAGSADLVILHSVVQYFPSAAYVLTVLAEAARVVGAGGRIFVGGVRNLALADACQTAAQLRLAAGDVRSESLKSRVAEGLRRETELLLAPGFFDALISDRRGIASAALFPTAGPSDDTLTTPFCYDVLLTVGAAPRQPLPPTRWFDWDPRDDWQRQLTMTLEAAPGLSLGVREIPHRSAARAVAAARLLDSGEYPTAGAIRDAVAVSHTQDTEVFTRLAEAFAAELRFSGVDASGRYHVTFNPRWSDIAVSDRDPEPVYASHANRPVDAQQGYAASLLRPHLRQRLPAHMLPATIIELDRIPLTANGKRDDRALPLPTYARAETYEAPRSVEEEALCDLFQEVLGAGVIGIHDNFFELGGHSLSAARLASLVHARFGVTLSMHPLFEAPSVARLAAYIREIRPAMPAHRIVPLRPHGRLAPLFCLPPVYGLGFAYAGLARELNPERPIYCLQSIGIAEGEPFAATVPDAVESYVEAIRAIRPAGPYHLFGWSFGGLMAYAVACRLQRDGEVVAQLAVIDAYPRWLTAPDRFISVSTYLADFREHLEDAVQDVDRTQIDRLLRLTINHAMLMTAFRPEVFDGDMLLIVAQENRHLPTLWAPFVRGAIDTHPLPYSHMELMMLEPLRRIGPLVDGDALTGRSTEAESYVARYG